MEPALRGRETHQGTPERERREALRRPPSWAFPSTQSQMENLLSFRSSQLLFF